jgi:hypothetical protein
MEHLDANLAAPDVQLSEQQIAALARRRPMPVRTRSNLVLRMPVMS